MRTRTKIIIGLAVTTFIGALVLCLVLGAGIYMVLFGDNQATENNNSNSSSCLPVGVTAAALPAATGSVSQQQITNAKAIGQAVKTAGLGGDALLIALTAAVGESSVLVLNYGDAAGPDSRGLFQQRNSWGTLAQRMNPGYSTLSFLLGPAHDGKAHGPGGTGLVAIPGWQQMTPTLAIHAVQINADPNHYTRYVAQAEAIATKAGLDLSQPATGTTTTGTTTTGASAGTAAASAGGDCGGGGADPAIGTGPCPLDSLNAPGKKNPSTCNKALTFMAHQVSNGSTGWYRQCLALVAESYGWRFSGTATARQAAQVVIDAHQMHHDTSNIPAGAVLWWDGSATGNTAGHVDIDDGKGYSYSNDVTGPGKVGRVPWNFPAKSWGQKFLGWSAPYFPHAG